MDYLTSPPLKSCGVEAGDPAGQSASPPLLLYLPDKFSLKNLPHYGEKGDTYGRLKRRMCLLGLVKAAVSIKLPSSLFLASPTAANLVDEHVYSSGLHSYHKLRVLLIMS